MYPREYRDDDGDYLYVPFRSTFDLIIGLSGVSDVVSKDVASEDVFLDKLVAMMKYTRRQMFKDTLGESDAELQKKAFKCLHNLAMDHRNYQKLRDKNFVDIIWSHFEDEAEENEDYEMQAGLEIIAYGALAALLDERESEAGHLHEGVVDYFKDELKECLECDDDDNRSPRKIVRIIRRLARNDCYKKNFGRRDIIPLLVETADRDSIRDQIESTGAIWELSFIEENQKKLLKNKEAMTMLELRRGSDNIDISNNCKGTLWNMRDLLSNKNQYKHLDTAPDAFLPQELNVNMLDDL